MLDQRNPPSQDDGSRATVRYTVIDKHMHTTPALHASLPLSIDRLPGEDKSHNTEQNIKHYNGTAVLVQRQVKGQTHEHVECSVRVHKLHTLHVN